MVCNCWCCLNKTRVHQVSGSLLWWLNGLFSYCSRLCQGRVLLAIKDLARTKEKARHAGGSSTARQRSSALDARHSGERHAREYASSHVRPGDTALVTACTREEWSVFAIAPPRRRGAEKPSGGQSSRPSSKRHGEVFESAHRHDGPAPPPLETGRHKRSVNIAAGLCPVTGCQKCAYL